MTGLRAAWGHLCAVIAIVAASGLVGLGTPARARPPREHFVPCPTVHVPAPTPSPMPSHDPTKPAIGGDALATTGLVVPAGAPRTPRSISATSWLVADMTTGAVLGACGPHRYGAPASVQKLLLAETVMPKLNPAQVIRVIPEDMNFEPGSSAVGLLVGGSYSIQTLWLGLFLNSGNDAATVLARLGGGAGGVSATIAAMNAEAHRLGAYDTHAVTPSGLDGPGQVTSVYDLALIARACFALADFRKDIATQSATIPAQPPRDKHGFQIQNDNRLLYEYSGALGGKVGFTDIARHTYVGAAERDGRRLVVALLGAESRPALGWRQGAALLDWGFQVPPDASVGRLVDPGELDRPAPAPTIAPERLKPASTVSIPVRTIVAVSVVAVLILFAAIGLTKLLVDVMRRVRGRRTPPPDPVPDRASEPVK